MTAWVRYSSVAFVLSLLSFFSIYNISFFQPKPAPWLATGTQNDPVDIGATSTLIPYAKTTSASTASPSKIIVVGKLEKEDTSWVGNDLPDWQNAIYTVDNLDASLHTPMNKGRESIAYLTYIIDHYDLLPDIIVFLHSHRDGEKKAWHVDNEKHDNVQLVKDLKLDYVKQKGYVNLRCGLTPGCSGEVQPFRDPPSTHFQVEKEIPAVWKELFANDDVPREIGVACCAQFAVMKRQVLARTKEDYQRYRQWVMNTKLPDHLSGRVMEFLWHIIFGMEAKQYDLRSPYK
ncbi:MAG: hypothetical protein Q9187_007285 [Circinaria calcarea]